MVTVILMFVILQKYDFSSKSQPYDAYNCTQSRCLWYCKSTIFQANHNQTHRTNRLEWDVCDTAKVRFFKQITTVCTCLKSLVGCLWYCKSTIFQANHNSFRRQIALKIDVCDTAKVRFFKQITTAKPNDKSPILMFVILQKYDFSSKSQPRIGSLHVGKRCLWYCKSTIFQANHNNIFNPDPIVVMFVILQKYDFSSKSQRHCDWHLFKTRCLWYCKSTIFQANHNIRMADNVLITDVCDTAKVRFFKQITTQWLQS